MRSTNESTRSMGPELLRLAVLLMAAGLMAACAPSSEVNYTPPDGSAGPAINHFSFSKMVVDNREFNEMDIVISADGKVTPWQIGSVHVVTPVDIDALISPATRVLIIGTGTNGVSKVGADALASAEAKGVTLHVLDTAAAVSLYNKMPKTGLAAAFHTGC